MINVYELATLTLRDATYSWGIMTAAEDREEWVGIRSQLLAIIYLGGIAVDEVLE